MFSTCKTQKKVMGMWNSRTLNTVVCMSFACIFGRVFVHEANPFFLYLDIFSLQENQQLWNETAGMRNTQ